MATHDELFKLLLGKYKKRSPAEGLFWVFKDWEGTPDRDLYGMRIEASDLLLEFKDNVNLGTDPAGYLFYNDVHDLTVVGSTKKCYYKVIQIKEDDPKKRVIHVKFYLKPGGDRALIAEFFAKDPRDALSGWKATDEERVGEWGTLQSASAVAYLSKTSRLWLSIFPIDRKASFTPKEPFPEDVAIWGKFSFLKVSKLTREEARWVDYSPDRIVFYKREFYSKDFAAYFTPNRADPSVQNVNSSGKVYNARWSDLEFVDDTSEEE